MFIAEALVLRWKTGHTVADPEILKVWDGRQYISPVVIYRKRTQ